jgi:hypothetical protein
MPTVAGDIVCVIGPAVDMTVCTGDCVLAMTGLGARIGANVGDCVIGVSVSVVGTTVTGSEIGAVVSCTTAAIGVFVAAATNGAGDTISCTAGDKVVAC